MKYPLVNPPNRVLQLDAKMLDNEVFNMLNKQLSESINNPKLPPFLHKFNSKFSSELKLILELIIFKFTIWDKNSSYGLILQNLVMFDGGDAEKRTKNELSKLKKILLLLNLIMGHTFKRLESYLYGLDDDEFDDDEEGVSQRKNSTRRKRLIRSILKFLRNQLPNFQKAYTLLSLGNFLIFLVKGQYPNLVTRILGIKYKALMSTSVSFASNPQTISYEFQDRQLVWNTLTEFIVFIMPIISIPKFSRKLVKLVKSKDDDSDSASKNEQKGALFKFLPERCCAICYQQASSKVVPGSGTDISVDDNFITNPHETNCGHLYCYYCIVNKLEEYKMLDNSDEEEKNWSCLRCNEPVEFCKVYDGDCEIALSEKVEQLSSDDEEEEEVEETNEDIDEDDSSSENIDSDESSAEEEDEGSADEGYDYEADEL